jgi:hypothetical protein
MLWSLTDIVIARSVSDEAIQTSLTLDCFVEPRHPAALRADRVARNDNTTE